MRMEPVSMTLSESAAITADLPIDKSTSVQDLNYASLEKALLEAKHILKP
jgi:hypothetical protein